MKIHFIALAFAFIASVSIRTPQAAAAEGDMCAALPKLENISAERCRNFEQFREREVTRAKGACEKYYNSVKEAAESLCEYSKDADRFDLEMSKVMREAGADKKKRRSARSEVSVRTAVFHRRWGTQFAAGSRRTLEFAHEDYKKALTRLNDFGLEQLRKEATECGAGDSPASPAYIGLALTAGYEAAHTHKYMTDIFNALVLAMNKEAERSQRLADGVDAPGPAPGRPGDTHLPEREEISNPAEPGVKAVIMEALAHVLKLHGLSSLGLGLAEKLLISKKMDTLDLIVLSVKAMVITAGGTSAGPTVGISLGIALAINGAIDYLEYGIRYFASTFEKLNHARMEEVLAYYGCKLRKKQELRSGELARSFHNHRQDGICGADCAEPGLFGVCRPSLLFPADRCD
ncbi:MAG TPA: hypothetical protein VIH99_03580 [Bdellovibrionota bacterium]|jgi:hypothetical protein